MASIISFLKNPDNVASFQRLCGIVREGVDKTSPREEKGKDGRTLDSDLHTNFDGFTNGIIRKHNRAGPTDKGEIQNGSGSAEASEFTDQNGFSRETVQDTDDYKITNKFLDHLFHFGASLGNEIFYITFFPFWFWNIDGFVGRRLCVFWCIFMYLGQALKDIIKIPRPPSPPVVRLEKRYALEYGMPSTHAMVGTGIPFAMFLMTKERYIYPSELALVGAIAWSSLVCCSRIYLGMHSLLDVVVGVGIVSGLMVFCLPWVDNLDEFMLHSPYSPALCILVPLLLCIFYPTLDKWSTARGDTTVILGVGAGVGLGHWVCFQYGYMQKAPTLPPYDIIPPTWCWFGLVLLRMVIGIIILVTMRAAVKPVTFRLACFLAGCDKSNSEAHKTLKVELPYKFATYCVIAFNMVYLAPIVFRYFGIERETFFTEI